jgi:predicted Zn-dependent protease
MKKYSILLLLFIFLGITFNSCKDDKDEDKSNPAILGDAPGSYLKATIPSLVIQVNYVTGFKPKDETITHLKNFLDKRLNKPGGIFINLQEIPSPQNGKYTLKNIKEVELKYRTTTSSLSAMSAYILYLDNDYIETQGNQVILGVAYSATSFAVFEKTILGLSGSLGEPSQTVLESAVSEHEFGHLLGLVNAGTPITSIHHDTQHGAHCTNEDCLMHYSIQTATSLGNLLGGNIPELDDDCIKDLQANGGK